MAVEIAPASRLNRHVWYNNVNNKVTPAPEPGSRPFSTTVHKVLDPGQARYDKTVSESMNMRVLIFGSGAVGLGLGSCLLKAGVRTALLAGPETVRCLKSDGLKRSGIFGNFSTGPQDFDAYTDLSQIKSQTFDYILVCTKSNHTHIAAEQLGEHRHLLKTEGKIVHFQNGWGNAEKFLPYFDRSVIYSGRVITGFTRPTPNHVEITVHADAVHVGSLFGQDIAPIKPLCEAIHSGDLPCLGWEKIEQDLWAKMLYNCALNPLGAILEVPYGKLADNPSTRQLMDDVIDEVFAVIDKSGYRTYWSTPAEYREVFYQQLIPPTAGHRSSTLQDIKAGRKTEIEALTGQVLKLAEQHGTEAPFNQTLYDLIAFIENSNRSH
ncbi:MAG: ketopantoate reductase family protein [Planctomycetota bacterium]